MTPINPRSVWALLLLLLIQTGCLSDLDFDDIEPECILPRFDVESRDAYCSGELTTSTVASQDGEDQFVTVASLNNRTAILQGTPIDRAAFYGYVDELRQAGMFAEAQQLQLVLDSNLPLYGRIVGWAMDRNALNAASLTENTATEVFAFSEEDEFAQGPIYRAQYMGEQGDALLILGFGGTAIVQLSGSEETERFRTLDLSRRLALEEGDGAVLDIDTWQPEPDRTVLLMAAGGSGLKSMSLVWDGTNWVEEFFAVTDIWGAAAVDDAAIACCLAACNVADEARCTLSSVRSACVYANTPWPNARECINQTFTHRISFIVSSVEVGEPSGGEPRLYLGGFSVEVGPNGEQLYRATVNTVVANQVDPRNYANLPGPTQDSVQQILPRVEGMADEDIMQVIDIAFQDDTLYVLTTIFPQEAFFNPQGLLLGDTRFALQAIKLTPEGLIDSAQPVRSIPFSLDDGDFTSTAYPELRLIGPGLLAMRTIRLKYNSISLEFGGSNLMIWDLAGNQTPSEPLRSYDEVFTSDNARRSHTGLIGLENATGGGTLFYPSVGGLERLDMEIGGNPLP